MKNEDKMIGAVFIITAVIFVFVVTSVGVSSKLPFSFAVPVFLFLLFAAGLLLLVLAVRSHKEKTLKLFLVLTGAASAAIPVFILLHGLIYGLFIKMFGQGFWGGAANSDEPVFFILAIVICPLAYLVGAIGSICLMARSGRKAKEA
jgi:hypothetical protein